MSAESVTSRLAKYMVPKLTGSTLQITLDGRDQLTAIAGEDISLKVVVYSEKRKDMEFSLFSPKLNRVVTFEEINDVMFLDVRLDDELKAENRGAEEADIYLAINLIQVWARENGYSLSHKV